MPDDLKLERLRDDRSECLRIVDECHTNPAEVRVDWSNGKNSLALCVYKAGSFEDAAEPVCVVRLSADGSVKGIGVRKDMFEKLVEL